MYNLETLGKLLEQKGLINKQLIFDRAKSLKQKAQLQKSFSLLHHTPPLNQSKRQNPSRTWKTGLLNNSGTGVETYDSPHHQERVSPCYRP
jgi:hypothetical protein